MEEGGFEPPKAWSRQIYSLLPLATRELLRDVQVVVAWFVERVSSLVVRVGAVELAVGLEPATS